MTGYLIVDVTDITINKNVGKFNRLNGIEGSIHYLKSKYELEDKLKSLLMYDNRKYEVHNEKTREITIYKTGSSRGKNNVKYEKYEIDLGSSKDYVSYVTYYDSTKNQKGFTGYVDTFNETEKSAVLKKYLKSQIRKMTLYNIKEGLITVSENVGSTWEETTYTISDYVKAQLEYRKNGYKK